MLMRRIRQLHLYLGCLFSPLLLYFCVSGAWQVFRLNDVPKENPTAIRRVLHELSKPHKAATLPGQDPRQGHSVLFNVVAMLMAAGVSVTLLLGIFMAFRFNKSPRFAALCLLAGLAIPVLFLFLR